MENDIIDYEIKDLLRVLNNIKNNPYGIKDTKHAFNRAKKRGIDINHVLEFLYKNTPIGIEKTYNESDKFQLLYEYKKSMDLCIIIHILNEEEIEIITIIEKNVTRRKH